MTKPEETQQDDDDLAGRDERRRRVRKRIIRIVVVLVVVFGCPVSWWLYSDWKWEREIQAELAGYRAAGQPVDLADFDPPPTPDEDNAALVLKQAADAITLTESQKELVNSRSPELVEENLDEFRKIVEANAEVLALARKARSMKGCDWGLRLRSPGINSVFPNMSNVRWLSLLMVCTAVYYHKTGDDAAAIETLRDALAAAGNQRKMPVLVADLVAISSEWIAYAAIEELTCRLVVLPDGAKEPAGAGGVARTAVEDLIKRLLDEEQIQKSGVTVWYAERAVMYDAFRLWLDGELSREDMAPWSEGPDELRLFRRLQKGLLPAVLRHWTAYATAGQKSNYGEAIKLLPEERQKREKSRKLWFGSKPESSVMESFAPDYRGIFKLRFRSIAMRRMAATALAARLYEIDHGRRPARLEELVPKYLPGVPADPFAEDGRPLGYLPNAPRPILYSVGDNGVDQGGKYADDPDEPPERDNFDIPFFLNGDRPREKDEAPEPERDGPAPASRPAPAAEG